MEVDVETLRKLLVGGQITDLKDCGRCLMLETTNGTVELLNEVSYNFLPKDETPKPVDPYAETRKIERPNNPATPSGDWRYGDVAFGC